MQKLEGWDFGGWKFLIRRYLLSKDGAFFLIPILLWPVFSKQNILRVLSFLAVNIGHNPSYIWRSILWGRGGILQGTRWKVGNGEDIRVCHDPWIPRPTTFKPITKLPAGLDDLLVSDLIANGAWDRDAVMSYFWEVDRKAIFSIPWE